MTNIYNLAFSHINEAINQISSDYNQLCHVEPENKEYFQNISKLQEMLSEVRNMANTLSIKNKL